eukprot:6207618-Pleurochrysis_carterae.AAC.1
MEARPEIRWKDAQHSRLSEEHARRVRAAERDRRLSETRRRRGRRSLAPGLCHSSAAPPASAPLAALSVCHVSTDTARSNCTRHATMQTSTCMLMPCEQARKCLVGMQQRTAWTCMHTSCEHAYTYNVGMQSCMQVDT